MTTALKIWALDAPTIQLQAADLMVGGEGDVRIPLPAFLIEHEQGLVLFDTSMDPAVNDDPEAYLGVEGAAAVRIETTPENRIDNQLAKLGFRCEDISHVILSHTHFDHAGGLYLFPQAKFLRGPGEFEWAANPDPDYSFVFRYEKDLGPTMGFDWTEMNTPMLDYFGDGSIRVYHTPGHTPGELSIRVKLPSRTITLTGDTVHLRAAYDAIVPDPHDWDLDAATESVRKLHEFEAEGDEIWIAHEPADWASYGGPRVAVS